MRSGIKKTMRVATTFTGAAACAVAFNPAAMAAAGQPAQTGHQQLDRMAGNRRISGHIRSDDCENPNESHWLHIEGPYGSGECFGFSGILSLSPWDNMQAYCGGTNSGIIFGAATDGPKSYYSFKDNGTYYYHLPKSVTYFYVNRVMISQWHGSAKCPAL